MSKEGIDAIIASGAEGKGMLPNEIERITHFDAGDKLYRNESNGLSFYIEGLSNQEGALFLSLSKEYPYYFGDLILFEREENTISIEEFLSKLEQEFPEQNIQYSDVRDSFKNVYVSSNDFFLYIVQSKKKTTYTISVYIREMNDVAQRLNTFLVPFVNSSNSTSAEISYFYYDSNRSVQRRDITKDASAFSYISDALYPGIDAKLLVEDFLASKENILILTGAAGVGKTTLVKYLIKTMAENGSKSETNIAYCKDEEMVRDDKFWVQLSSEYQGFEMLILDDFDHGLAPREETNKENTFVSKLLSFSDGIFDNNIKVVITTNRDIESIDAALVRPGRCFDILRMRSLKVEEAFAIWKEIGLTETDFKIRFPEKTETISQALLMSEVKAVNGGQNRGYLLEDNISVREKFASGYMKRKAGFLTD